jgi:hypothetical protein
VKYFTSVFFGKNEHFESTSKSTSQIACGGRFIKPCFTPGAEFQRLGLNSQPGRASRKSVFLGGFPQFSAASKTPSHIVYHVRDREGG